MLFRCLACLMIAASPVSAQPQTPVAASEVPADAQIWSPLLANRLLAEVEASAADGLDPVDYRRDALKQALGSGDATAVHAEADAGFALLAHDLAVGHVAASRRIAWHVTGARADPPDIAAWRAAALASGDVAGTLAALRPSHPQYARLKAALSRLPAADTETRELLRINLERWRWMPRLLGEHYILVNVPSFELMLVQGNAPVIRHRVIVGKTGTPTPQFATVATGVILNPEWVVPQSIIRESVGKLVRNNPAAARARGYVWSGSGATLSVRQSPGPGNSLGHMKIDMPNPFTIYLHDTPARQLFDKPVRTFSHGCIRTDKALDFADALLPDHDRAQIDTIVATRKTTRIALPQQLPVYVAYFTAAANEDGSISRHPDIYGRDAPVAASLTDRQDLVETGAVADGGCQAMPNLPA